MVNQISHLPRPRSVLNAVYRDSLDLPRGLPAEAEHTARDSLSGALETAATLPAQLAAQVTGAARHAYVDGMHAALLCSTALAAVVSLAALRTLRDVPKVIPEHTEDDSPALTGTRS